MLTTLLLVVCLLTVFTSCDFLKKSEEPVYSTYFLYEDGEKTSEWIMLSDSAWIYSDGTSGTLLKDGEAIVLQKDGETLASGLWTDGTVSLTKDGETKVYGLSANKEEKDTVNIETVFAYAQESGYTGTLEELVAAFQGDGAYQVAVKNGYEGTETEWLQTLVGADGKTPSIGQNGNWFIGSTDTGVSANGNKGDTGVGIVDIQKTGKDGNKDIYTITMSDGNTSTFTVTNGVDGTAAEKGVGVSDISKTGSSDNVDTYLITMTDGTTYTYSVTNGVDGKDAVSIKKVEKTGTVGNVDTYTILMTDGSTFSFTVTNGKSGKDGKDGKDATYDLTVAELFEQAQLAGYEGDYLSFLAEYLPTQDTAYVTRSAFSTVSILCPYQYVSWGTVSTVASSGTGVFYSVDTETGDAYIITNYHVVYCAEQYNESTRKNEGGISKKIYVYLYGSEVIGNEYATSMDYEGMYTEAEYIGGSMNHDIALLKVTGSKWIKGSQARSITFSDSEDAYAGETVWAVGNSGGEGIAITKGVLSMTSESLTLTGADNKTSITLRVLRYDASVNPGNSGGALLNNTGELVGIVNAKMTDTEYDNVGYAIPANVVKNVVENILYYYQESGYTAPVKVQKMRFGVSYTGSRAYATYDESTGRTVLTDNLRIASVDKSSILYGEIEVGDIFLSVTLKRGTEETVYQLTRAHILQDLCLNIRAGDVITITFERGESTLSTEVTITDDNLVITE